MSEKKVNFGIIGCGNIANTFAKAIQCASNAQLYAVSARNPEKAKEFAKKYGNAKVHKNYLDLIQDPEVTVVYISLINSLHYEIAKLCIENKKAVLCEKPFFLTVEKGQEIQKLAQANNVFVMEALWTRCLPTYAKTKQWVEDNEIGEIKMIDTSFCFNFSQPQNSKNYRIADNDGGGALYDLGVYCLNFATGILNSYPTQITSVATTYPNGIDETVCVTMKFENGAIAVSRASFAMNAENTGYIYGDNGYIKLNKFYGATTCEKYAKDGTLLETFTDSQTQGFVHQIEHVAAQLRQNKTESPLMPLSHSIKFAEMAREIQKQCNLNCVNE